MLFLLGGVLAACNEDVAVTLPGTASAPAAGDGSEPQAPPGTPSVPLIAKDEAAPAIPARDYDAFVINPNDGTRIAITVLQPALEEGEAAPLVLHSHGFGGTRLRGRDRMSLYEQLSGGVLPSTEAARRAAEAGYFVISFDQRGFGESGGTVQVIDPRYEGEDIKAILNWAEDEMEHRGHLGYRGGDVALGALGLSYGGGYQLIGAAVDSRFDAIVPTAAWYDLTYSLSPGDVVKTDWGVLLVALGIPTSRVRLDPLLYQALLEGLAVPLTQSGFSNDVKDKFYNNSLRSFCERRESVGGQLVASATGRRAPTVDALIIHGVSDTLFNLNEGWESAQCLRAAGNDVHFIGMQDGHTLPVLQSLDDRIAYNTERTLRCGDQTFDTATLELDYLDWKLRGAVPARVIPRNCVTVNDDEGVVFDTLPIAEPDDGTQYAVSGSVVTGGLSVLEDVLSPYTVPDLVDLLGNTVDNVETVLRDLLAPPFQLPADSTAAMVLAQVVNALPAEDIDQLLSGATFIPLTTIERSGQALVGIPVADIELGGGGIAPVAFLGVGIRTDVSETAVLVNQQVRPVRGTGERRIELNGISRKLQPGDEVGLLVYGYHPQYLASFTLAGAELTVSGDIGLPIIALAENR